MFRRKSFVGTLVALLGFAGCSSIALSQTIDWRVDGNFRLLKNNGDQDWLVHVAKQSDDLGAVSITTDSLRGKWSAVPESVYNKTEGTYESGYAFPKVWRIVTGVSGVASGATCTWTLNSTTSQGACSEYRIPQEIGKGPHKLKVTTDTGVSTEVTLSIEDTLIVGIGDSYASGEGVPDVSRRWFRNSDWWDTKCHRSLYSWQVLSAARVAADNPHKSVTFISRACSGALIAELTKSRSKGATGESATVVGGLSDLAPQLENLRKDLCPNIGPNGTCLEPLRQPDIVLLSIGGNDAKFATVIKDAILNNINEGINLKSAYRRYAVEGVRYLRAEYPKLAAELSGLFPKTKVVMTVYPDPLHRNPSAFCGVDDCGGQQCLRLKSKGFLGFFAGLLGKREENSEVAAIYDDFVARLTGSPNPYDEDYKGILQIGKALSEKYKEQWLVVATRRGLGQDQAPGFQPHGYCRPGEDVSGRWFLTVDDSERHIGGLSGAMHPNLFGQLYYVSKVYPVIRELVSRRQ